MFSPSRKILESPNDNGDFGFSLLEMLIALAIMSLTSVALFQSISTMLNVSDRAVRAGERTLEDTIARTALSQLIDGLIPQWSERPEDSLRGESKTFSAISANAIHSAADENAPFTLSIRSGSGSEGALVYETKAENWILEKNLPGSMYFEYLDRKNVWHKAWPPARKSADHQEDIMSQLIIERLPQAIRMNIRPGVQKHVFVIGGHQFLPDRLEMILE